MHSVTAATRIVYMVDGSCLPTVFLTGKLFHPVHLFASQHDLLGINRLLLRASSRPQGVVAVGLGQAAGGATDVQHVTAHFVEKSAVVRHHHDDALFPHLIETAGVSEQVNDNVKTARSKRGIKRLAYFLPTVTLFWTPEMKTNSACPKIKHIVQICAHMLTGDVESSLASHMTAPMLKWFVGSSNKSKSGRANTAAASIDRTRQPPLNCSKDRARSSSLNPKLMSNSSARRSAESA